MKVRRPIPQGSEGGFTLVELLVVLVVLPMILAAITAVVITSLKNQTATSSRISDSSSAQITSAFYVRDVESSTFVTTDAGATNPLPCGAGTSSTTGLSFKLGFTWGSQTAGGVLVSYWEDPSTGTVTRLYCTNGSQTPASTVTVATGLSTSSALNAVVSPPTMAAEAAQGWVSSVGVSAVTFSALESASAYNFDLLAVPRVAVQGTGGTPAPPPLLLLGSGADVLQCNGSNGNINVNGAAYIDSTANGSVNIGNSTLTASQFYSADTSPGSSVTAGPNGSYTPDPPTYGSPIPDPYASLTPPTAAAAPSPTTSGGTTYYYPGYYSSGLSISSNGTVVFETGTYIFNGGISTSGGANISSAPGGVLFYVPTGQISLTGNGSLTLTPETPAPYPTAPSLVIWQASTDTNPVYVAGNGGVHTISGTIYAPGAEVGGGGNGSYQAGSIVAAGLGCNGNGSVYVG